jgi:formylglycine-generating enzyme required for sulfatase activity
MVECGVVNAEFTCKVKAWSKEVPPPYAVFDLDGSKKAAYFNSEDALPGGITSRVYRTDKMVFRRIPAANRTFRAGAKKTATGFAVAESVRYVTLTNDYYLGIFPVTQGQYKMIMGSGAANPSTNAGAQDADLTPVNMMSGAQVGISYGSRPDVTVNSVDNGTLLKKMREVSGVESVYLPTYSEWEFACRAGSAEDVYGGYGIDEVAWHAGNSGGAPRPVGLKKANGYGLYDMLGNVSERVRDSASMQAATLLQVSPYYGADSWGSHHMMMGGSFATPAVNMRASAYVKGSGGGYNSNGVWEARYFSYANETFGVRFCIPLR